MFKKKQQQWRRYNCRPHRAESPSASDPQTRKIPNFVLASYSLNSTLGFFFKLSTPCILAVNFFFLFKLNAQYTYLTYYVNLVGIKRRHCILGYFTFKSLLDPWYGSGSTFAGNYRTAPIIESREAPRLHTPLEHQLHMNRHRTVYAKQCELYSLSQTTTSQSHRFNHTARLRHTTLSMTPLDQWSALRRGLYLTTHDTHKRQISMPPA